MTTSLFPNHTEPMPMHAQLYKLFNDKGINDKSIDHLLDYGFTTYAVVWLEDQRYELSETMDTGIYLNQWNIYEFDIDFVYTTHQEYADKIMNALNQFLINNKYQLFG